MRKTILFVLCLSACATAAAAPTTFSCPQHAPVAASAQPQNGWAVYKSKQQGEANGLDFLLGHPRDMASLAPDTQRTRGARVESTWVLTEASDHYWLGCSYEKTPLQFVQPLPATLTRCIKVTSIQKNAGKVQTISCT
jgi:hypothetical protein